MVESEAYLLIVPLVVAVLILAGLGELRPVAEAAARAPAAIVRTLGQHLHALFNAVASWMG